jgi:type IV secretory pathway TraG/TraD family ATPase VirD4
MIGVLDEAANVCRWKDLPDLYSHYGSRGIVLITILQSWAQGVGCWGDRGMEKLWSAANRRIYGGGVDDATFLDRLTKIIGDKELTSKQGTSVNRQLQREQILDIAELAALSAGRAIVFSSGSRATLVRSIPWMERPYADRIRASLARHDPGARNVISRPLRRHESLRDAARHRMGRHDVRRRGRPGAARHRGRPSRGGSGRGRRRPRRSRR